MIKKSLIASGVVLLLAAVSAFVYDKNESNSIDALFNANVEALTQDEIIVGDLCMQAPARLCFSLGEYFENHQRA